MIDRDARSVVGRYAPSPTGDLHFGSLVAAVASYCSARAAGGHWLVRIDDLDRPRVVAGSADRILKQLAAFGLRPDEKPIYQSMREQAYRAAITRLQNAGHAFVCGCTRREAKAGTRGLEGPIYPGTCRTGLAPGRSPRSIRLRVPDERIECADAVQGRIVQNLARDIGDFVIRRADGVTAYQLATVVDDDWQGVTEVVRGADLASSSPRQAYLQRCLDMAPTQYLHVPTVVDAHGEKLGKSTGALAIDAQNAPELLRECLTLLGQAAPPEHAADDVQAILGHGVAHWCVDAIPAQPTIARRR